MVCSIDGRSAWAGKGWAEHLQHRFPWTDQAGDRRLRRERTSARQTQVRGLCRSFFISNVQKNGSHFFLQMFPQTTLPGVAGSNSTAPKGFTHRDSRTEEFGPPAHWGNPPHQVLPAAAEHVCRSGSNSNLTQIDEINLNVICFNSYTNRNDSCALIFVFLQRSIKNQRPWHLGLWEGGARSSSAGWSPHTDTHRLRVSLQSKSSQIVFTWTGFISSFESNVLIFSVCFSVTMSFMSCSGLALRLSCCKWRRRETTGANSPSALP